MKFLINFFKVVTIFSCFFCSGYVGFHMSDWLKLLGMSQKLIDLIPVILSIVFMILLAAVIAAAKTSWECRE